MSTNAIAPAFLYRHFDGGGKLLYIGISINALNRLAQHKEHSHWFQQISKVEIETFTDRESALKAEREAVAKEKPAHNRQLQVKNEIPKRVATERATEAVERPFRLHLNPLYKLQDAASILCMGSTALRQLIENGKIGYVDITPPRTRSDGQVRRKYGVTGWQIIEYLESQEKKVRK